MFHDGFLNQNIPKFKVNSQKVILPYISLLYEYKLLIHYRSNKVLSNSNMEFLQHICQFISSYVSDVYTVMYSQY